MPLPPPPADALIITGYPISLCCRDGLVDIANGVLGAGDGHDAGLRRDPAGGELVSHRRDRRRLAVR